MNSNSLQIMLKFRRHQKDAICDLPKQSLKVGFTAIYQLFLVFIDLGSQFDNFPHFFKENSQIWCHFITVFFNFPFDFVRIRHIFVSFYMILNRLNLSETKMSVVLYAHLLKLPMKKWIFRMFWLAIDSLVCLFLNF